MPCHVICRAITEWNLNGAVHLASMRVVSCRKVCRLAGRHVFVWRCVLVCVCVRRLWNNENLPTYRYSQVDMDIGTNAAADICVPCGTCSVVRAAKELQNTCERVKTHIFTSQRLRGGD